MFQVFGQSESGRVTVLRIFLQTLQTDRGKITVDFAVPQARLPRFSIQH
jgi:ABC-type Na+ transport system ATPase subunit NatA